MRSAGGSVWGGGPARVKLTAEPATPRRRQRSNRSLARPGSLLRPQFCCLQHEGFTAVGSEQANSVCCRNFGQRLRCEYGDGVIPGESSWRRLGMVCWPLFGLPRQAGRMKRPLKCRSSEILIDPFQQGGYPTPGLCDPIVIVGMTRGRNRPGSLFGNSCRVNVFGSSEHSRGSADANASANGMVS